jgi:hypothetical protein
MNDQYNQLINYVHEQLQRGVSAPNIRQALVDANWDQAMVDHALGQLLGNQTPVQAAPAHPFAVEHPATPVEHNQQPDTDTQPQPTLEQQNYTQPDPAHTQQAYPESDMAYYPNPELDNQMPAEEAPKKFRVWKAIAQSLAAIKHNPISILVALVVGYGASVAMTVGIIAAFTGTYSSLILSSGPLGGGGSSIVALIGIVLAVFVAGAFARTLVLCLVAQALYDGAERQKVPVGQTLKRGFKGLLRVFVASVLYGLVIVGPEIVSGTFFFFTILSGQGSFGGANVGMISIVAYFGSIVWMIIAMLRYSLAPYIALLEPSLPVTKTLSRSFHLLRKGGQWFIFKGALLVFLIMIIIGILAGEENIQSVASSNNMIVIIVSSLLSILIDGSMVMLYRNRRIIRQ